MRVPAPANPQPRSTARGGQGCQTWRGAGLELGAKKAREHALANPFRPAGSHTRGAHTSACQPGPSKPLVGEQGLSGDRAWEAEGEMSGGTSGL